MINDILDLAKIESGKMEVRLTEFRIDARRRRPSATWPARWPRRRTSTSTSKSTTDLPELRQDQGKVQQILNNLLSNAIKFTPEGGRIVVSAARARRAAPACWR